MSFTILAFASGNNFLWVEFHGTTQPDVH